MSKNRMACTITRLSIAWLAMMFALLLFVSRSDAQSTTDGAIGGTVLDTSGAAVPNAKVTVKNLGTDAEEVVMTDDTGYFRVGKLQPATYSVSVSAQGFAPFTLEHVIVQVGSVTEVTAKLNVASAGATVVVTAEIPQVNTNSAEFAPTVDQA
ncbi:MAG TPA: carboxypeptidase-like regulatory domain-containing protein, partial [Candidatus Acidoferrum sp.]|nr:carboxypeptidase-like regulatory domain-containing protein [Candidatus Acidoferrum sp.]